MKIFLILFLFTFFSLGYLNATNYYVATTGNDLNNAGSEQFPFATITKAISMITTPGDIIYVRGGTYTLLTRISISKSGTSGAYYNLFAYPGERPLLDFSGMSVGGSNQGIYLSGNYWYIKGISLKGAGDNGIKIKGSYNKIENCEFYENRDSGMQLDTGASNNQVINCDSYYNADPTDYGDADGFAVKMDVGSGNYFYGCRAWMNCDDGWDGYLRGTDNVTNAAENCWAFKNGYFKTGVDAGANANGNGFKMGGSDDKTLMHNFTLKNCLAFNNKAKGFDQNNNKGSMTLLNCTGYHNLVANYRISTDLNAGKTLIVKNCVSLGAYGSLGSFAIQATNSWLTPFVVNNLDFLSIDTTEALAPRKADGSLPDINFLHLAAGSDLIDTGTDVGIAFNGNLPDLGAWETMVSSIMLPKSLSEFSCSSSLVTNFAKLQFNISRAGYLDITFIAMDGKILSRETKFFSAGKNEISIDLNGFPKGYYICRVLFGKEVYFNKILKQ